MDIDALSASPVGRLVPLRGNDARHGPFAYFAFLPTALPEDFDLSSRTWTAVTRAASALARLDQACAQLPDPRLLIRPALYREALDTSALEGTVAPLQDLLEAQLGSNSFLSPQALEVNAYVSVAMQAFEAVRERPISVNMLSNFQAELLRYSSQKPRSLGRIRDEAVWIGPEDRPIYDARFVPPPADDRLQSSLDDWEAWVQRDREYLPPVLQAAIAHYQFETIHPFGDGNGRLGRLVVVLQLLRAKAVQEPAITLSPWFLRRRLEYQDHLLRLSCTGDWGPWVEFFCHAVCEQSESLIRGASALRDWLEQSRQLLHVHRWTGKIHELLQDLIEWPVTTVADTSSRYRTSVGNATRMIEHLVEVDVLQELTGKPYRRVFGSRSVMRIVDSI